MAKVSQIYNYVSRYLAEHASKEFKINYLNRCTAFLYMNISEQRDADKDIYATAEDLYQSNEEFQMLVTGCLANLKRVYGNSEIINFDETYKTLKTLMGLPATKLDDDYKKLPTKYQFIPRDEYVMNL
ncbi:MAG TPA: hypothetical protein DCO89_00240 [Clostridiales bacterium]|nr:hypothetical protein [Clostridiales bacterium]